MKVARIEWVDATDAREMEMGAELDPLAAISAGVLIRETEEFVTIARDYFADAEVELREPLTIHRCMIRRIDIYPNKEGHA